MTEEIMEQNHQPQTGPFQHQTEKDRMGEKTKGAQGASWEGTDRKDLPQGEQGPKEGNEAADELSPAFRALLRQGAAESCVLLKNQGILPLAAGEKLSVFGRGQWNYRFAGGEDREALPGSVGLLEALRRCPEIELDEVLAEQYGAWCKKHEPGRRGRGMWQRSYPEWHLKVEQIREAAANRGVALVVIGRGCGEGQDHILVPGSYYLSKGERDLLNQVTMSFDRVLVLVNSGGLMDFSWIADYGNQIQGLLLAWMGGLESGNGVVDVLTGRVNPCGGLADSISRRYRNQPSVGGFGQGQTERYSEDVFVGYRYFERFAPKKLQYPFGYGLSYTSFRRELCTARKQGKFLRFQVWVKNTGDRAGKEIVQIYVRPPWGRLGKPKRVLVCFGKTKLLEPEEGELLELSCTLRCLASYDDSGVTGYPHAYVMEEGKYHFYLGRQVRDPVPVWMLQVPETLVLGHAEPAMILPEWKNFQRLVIRERGRNTEPGWEKLPVDKLQLNRRILGRLPPAWFPMGGSPLQGDSPLFPGPDRSPKPPRTGGDRLDWPGQGGAGTEIPWENDPPPLPHSEPPPLSFHQLAAGKQSLEEFVGRMSEDQLKGLIRGEREDAADGSGERWFFGGVTQALQALKLPRASVVPGNREDGGWGILPCGMALACTWDTALTEALYRGLGEILSDRGVDLLLGPGMDLRRNPLYGGQFDSFSEDPLLTGKMGAAAVRGLQEGGVGACPGQFGCHQRGKGENYDVSVSQRALREIYLRGFEICVKEAKPIALMVDRQKLNGVRGCYGYDLCTTLLREEWGYTGMVVTEGSGGADRSRSFPDIRGDAYRIRAQVDLRLPGPSSGRGKLRLREKRDGLDCLDRGGGLKRGELQRSVGNILVGLKGIRMLKQHAAEQKRMAQEKAAAQLREEKRNRQFLAEKHRKLDALDQRGEQLLYPELLYPEEEKPYEYWKTIDTLQKTMGAIHKTLHVVYAPFLESSKVLMKKIRGDRMNDFKS